MKFNLEVEIEWFDEDMSIDESVKQSIIHQIKTEVAAPIVKQIKESADQQINEMLSDMASDAIKKRIDKFLSKGRDITDRFGEVTDTNVTIEDLLKREIDSAFTEKTLDKSGKRSGYNAKYSLFDFLVSKKTEAIPEMIENLVKAQTVETKEMIEKLVKDKVKTQVADKLTDLIVENSSALSLRTD